MASNARYNPSFYWNQDFNSLSDILKSLLGQKNMDFDVLSLGSPMTNERDFETVDSQQDDSAAHICSQF